MLDSPQQAVDPQTCGNCTFYQGKKIGEGTCRRYPPTVNLLVGPPPPGQMQMQVMVKADFVPVLSREWCGEWTKKVSA